jgi:starch phosphorylase
MFFNRDAQGIPREWLKRVRQSMATLVSQFTTDRMVKEYTNKYYLTK